MGGFRLSWPYQEKASEPYWGEPNSNFNFCEEDYILSEYVAELINTITNFIYVSYAIYGICRNLQRKPQDLWQRNLSYVGIALVGLLSAWFHMTLKYYTQWCDDLSMLLATGIILHRVYTFDKSAKYTLVSGLGLTAFLGSFATWHCIVDETTMHSILFGVMVHFVRVKTQSIIKERVSNPVLKKKLGRVAVGGALFFLTGFIIWNIDNHFCATLTRMKRAVGMPWSFVLEGHGWWHIFTGMGAYVFIALVEYLTSEDADKPLEGRFAWPVASLIGVPSDATPQSLGNDHVANGIDGKKAI